MKLLRDLQMSFFKWAQGSPGHLDVPAWSPSAIMWALDLPLADAGAHVSSDEGRSSSLPASPTCLTSSSGHFQVSDYVSFLLPLTRSILHPRHFL
jgi:hypothetical protein